MAVWDKFIVHLRDQKRYASHTLRAYENDLSGFFAYCGEAFECFKPGEVTREMIRSYIVCLVDRGLARRSVQRKISTLKSFYNYLIREGLVERNPVYDIQLPRPGNELPAFITKEAMKELVDRLPEPVEYPEARTRMVMLMLYGTGMRVAELVGLQLSSLSPSGDIIRVSGKRNKQRDIPLGNFLRNELKLYMDQRLSLPGNEESLFITDKGKPIYPKWVYNNVRLWLSLVTTQEKKSPHILRHSFATHMLDDGADLNAIKEILGHASLAATQVYTHNTIEKLRKIYEQAHPRA